MILRSVFALCASAAIAGCSSGEVTVGIDVPATGAAASAISRSGTTTTTPTHSAAILVNRVRLLVDDAKIQGGTSGRCGGGDGSQAGPFVIDLSSSEIAKGAHRELSVSASTSETYTDVEIEIEPLGFDRHRGAADVSGAEFDEFRASGASLLVDGTFKGKAFQFAGHFKAEQGKEGTFDLASGATIAIPLNVNPSTWFVDAAGKDMDPTDAARHSAAAVAICKQLDTEIESSGPGAGREHCVE